MVATSDSKLFWGDFVRSFGNFLVDSGIGFRSRGSSTDYNRMKELKEFNDSKIGVKGLSDSGITAIPKFFIQLPETLSTLKSSSFSTGSIPVIDLSNINSPKL
ncbi:hypothetical protein ACSBR1_002660 [Camellia fascicularis]